MFSRNDANLQVCLLIDGLDEQREAHHEGRESCSQQPLDRQGLLVYLRKLADGASFSECHIKMVLSSRAEGIFHQCLRLQPKFAIQDYTKDAICMYVQTRVQSRLAEYDHDHSQCMELCRNLTEKAQGVFMWVKIVVEQLIVGFLDSTPIEQLREDAEKLPEKLSELYQEALKRRNPDSALETSIMFQLVVKTLAPLDLQQLMGATDITMDAGRNVANEVPMTSMKRRLASRCRGLLEISNGSPFDSSATCNVQLSHQTVKSYIDSPGTMRNIFHGEDVPQEEGSYYLLKYCTSMVAQPAHPMTKRELSSTFGDLRYLFRYAAIEDSRIGGQSLEPLLLQLLRRVKDNSVPLADGSISHQPGSLPIRRDGLYVWTTSCLKLDCPVRYECLLSQSRRYSLLMVAAAHGLFRYVEATATRLLTSPVRGQCPIIYCAVCSTIVNSWGYGSNAHTVDMVRCLLDKGASADAKFHGRTPLGFLLNWCTSPKAYDASDATWKTILGVTKLLLDRDADANASLKGLTRSSLLGLAIESKHYSARLIRLLVEGKADVFTPDENGYRPLYHAVHQGNRDAVYVLLHADADPCDMGRGIDGLDSSTSDAEDSGSTFEGFSRDMQDLFRDFTPRLLDKVLDRADRWETREICKESFAEEPLGNKTQ